MFDITKITEFTKNVLKLEANYKKKVEDLENFKYWLVVCRIGELIKHHNTKAQQFLIHNNLNDKLIFILKNRHNVLNVDNQGYLYNAEFEKIESIEELIEILNATN